MHFLASFGIFLSWVLLVFPSSAAAQLRYDSTCYNVVINDENTSTQTQIDGSVLIDSAFDIIKQIGGYAKDMLTNAIWEPSFSWGNRQRVVNLLVAFGLREEHPNFHDMVNVLIGTLAGIRESLRGADARDQLNIMITQFNPKTGMTLTILAGPYTATPPKTHSSNTPCTPKTTGT